MHSLALWLTKVPFEKKQDHLLRCTFLTMQRAWKSEANSENAPLPLI
jgi:hypothetical protein